MTSKRSRTAGVLLLAGSLTLGGWALQRSAEARTARKSVVGSWRIERTIVPGEPIPVGVLYTFAADGTLTTGRSGAGYSSGHGSWRLQGRHVLGTVYYVRQTSDGVWSGLSKTWTDWKLSADGTRLSGRVHTDVFDLQGTVIQQVDTESEAVRINAERYTEVGG